VRRQRGLVLIIGYKLAKGVLYFIFAIVLVVMMRFGLEDKVRGIAYGLRHHAGAWSIELGKLVARAASPRGLWVITVALAADSIVSLVEAWALIHGHWWGPWLVALATGSLLPFEVFAFFRHPHVVRAAVFVANAAIVVYLVREAWHERDQLPRRRGRAGT
jgi:uncharacterized membrane protein (DUF2068 family)